MIAPAVVLLVVIAVVLGLGSTILEQFRSQNCIYTSGNQWNSTDSSCRNASGTVTTAVYNYGYNATIYGEQGLNTFASFQTTIAIVIVAGVILGVIGAVLMKSYV